MKIYKENKYYTGVGSRNTPEHILRFMEAVGEPIENAYAFGDSTNDIEMLKMAGTAIAMGNGADLAKAV